MAESQDLCLGHGSIPETFSNRVEQRKNDREHGARKLLRPSFKFNWLNESLVFGGDSIPVAGTPVLEEVFHQLYKIYIMTLLHHAQGPSLVPSVTQR